MTSVDYFRSSVLGSPLRTSLGSGSGTSVDWASFKRTGAGNRRKGPRRAGCLRLGFGDPGFSPRKIGFSSDGFRVKCLRESFPKAKDWIRSLSPHWKEGLFLLRCSVFVAVISVTGMLVWYAQRQARSFVETHLLPSACSILSEHLQRELDFGKVRSVSPLGITLESCSIGPHNEEFSCGEVPTMKLRLCPFASLRRGKIVIDAVLFEPCLLVAQKEDFSWLGIPTSSVNDVQRHHSSEEGIDYRTKTRRIAREESAIAWARQRVKAAKEAAEIGYIVPEEHSSVFRDEDFKDEPHLSAQPDTPSPFFCIDDHMHSKDHHSIETTTSSVDVLKHRELGKSSGARSSGLGIKFSSRIIPAFLRHKFKRNGKGKFVVEGAYTSKQRNLKRSAAAALAFFRGQDHGNSSEPSSKDGIDLSSGGNGATGFELPYTKDNVNSDVHVTLNNGFDKTRLEDVIEQVDLDNEEFKPQMPAEAADSISNMGNFDVQRDDGILTKGNMENQYLPEDHTSCLQIDGNTIAASNSSPDGLNCGDLDKHHSDFDHENEVDFDNLKEPVELHGTMGKSEETGGVDSQGFNFRKFGTCTQMYHSKTFNLFTINPWKTLDKIAVYKLLSPHLTGYTKYLRSFFSINSEDYSAKVLQDVTESSSKGIEKVLPITLDSVHFAGGTLMILGFGDNEPREMVDVDGHVRLQKHYSRLHVQLSGNCMEWRQEHTSQGGGELSADVFVNILEQKWHANLKIRNIFAPLFEGILEIPITWLKGRATGEIHICMSRGDSFPSLHGQLDVKGLSFHILDTPSMFSELAATLCCRGQRIFLHNASGWFGDAPLEASGDFGINPEDGEFHLMCQVPCVEVNALMKTFKNETFVVPVGWIYHGCFQLSRSTGCSYFCWKWNYIKSPQAEFTYNNFVNRTIKKTPFEAAYGHKPQHVFDLVPLPEEVRVSEDRAAFADHIRHVHDEVRAAIEASNEQYKERANQHRRFKEFAAGDQVMVHLKRSRFPKGSYHKLASRKIGPCKIMKKLSPNAYVVELPDDLQISPIFNVADLFEFYGFDGDAELAVDKEWAKLVPKRSREMIEEILDMKEACSRRGNQYRRFLIKWLGKPATESTWISEEELKKIDPIVYDQYIKAFSIDSSSLHPEGVDAGAT